MTLRKRRVLFYGLVALFLVGGIGVVLYAQGWRINLTTFKAQKVGAIFVRSYPDNTQIFLDGKSVENKSGFLSHGTLMSDLFPKNYTIALKYPGYDAWTEKAEVDPTLVAQFKYAVLVPSNATSVLPLQDVNNFLEASGNIVAHNASGTLSWRGKALEAGTIVSNSTDFKNAIIESPAGNYSVYDFVAGTSTNLGPFLSQENISAKSIVSIMIDPSDDTSILVQTPQKIITIDLSTDEVTVIAVTTPGKTFENSVAISSSLFAWADYDITSNTSNIIVYDIFSNNIVDNSLTVDGHIKQLTWIKNQTLGVLQENGSLYQYNVQQESFDKLGDDAKAFYVAPDGTMIAALESRSVEIFSLTTSDYYRFNLPDMASVESLMWYKDETHLFVNYPDHINFLDFADMGLNNFTIVSLGTNAHYDQDENALYLIDQGKKLIRFDFPN